MLVYDNVVGRCGKRLDEWKMEWKKGKDKAMSVELRALQDQISEVQVSRPWCEKRWQDRVSGRPFKIASTVERRTVISTTMTLSSIYCLLSTMFNQH